MQFSIWFGKNVCKNNNVGTGRESIECLKSYNRLVCWEY